jgi:hypothetical protein
MKKKLVYSQNNQLYFKDLKIIDDMVSYKSTLNKTCINILKLLWQEELYPTQVAKRLRIDSQKVYYYFRKLEKSGLIKVTSKQEIKGALAKYYRTAAPAFGMELPLGESNITDDTPDLKNLILSDSIESPAKRKLKNIFEPFTVNNNFNGLIVVGSPDPHGPFKARARDGHYAIYLSILLGNLINLNPLKNSEKIDEWVKLDVEVRAENRVNENLIVIGGPGVNMVTAELNKHLPIFLLGESYGEAPKAIFGSELYSDLNDRSYKEETIGYIIKQPNPFNHQKTIIVLAGLGRRGTKAAVLALTHFYDELISARESKTEFAHVVRGVDLAGHGSINNIEILE